MNKQQNNYNYNMRVHLQREVKLSLSWPTIISMISSDKLNCNNSSKDLSLAVISQNDQLWYSIKLSRIIYDYVSYMKSQKIINYNKNLYLCIKSLNYCS